MPRRRCAPAGAARRRDHRADHRQLVARRALSGRRRGRRFRPRLASRRGGGTRRAGVGPDARPRLTGGWRQRSNAERRFRGRRGPPWRWSRSRPSCWLAAALGLLFEVGGLPARPALGLLALGAGAALVASALAVRILGQRLRDAELLARRSRDALRLVADWYWEQDREFRFTYISDAAAPADRTALDAPARPRPLGAAERRHERGAARPAPCRPRGAPAVRRPDRAPPRSAGPGAPAQHQRRAALRRRRACSTATAAWPATSPTRSAPSAPSPPARRATASCSSARPRRSSCTATASSSMPTRRPRACSASPTPRR